MPRTKVKMMAKLVAVYGHYDSRGGTMAIPIRGFGPEALNEAHAKYNEQFGWTPETGVTTAGVGREVDNLVHKLTYGDDAPSTSDFLYKAMLHYDATEWPDGPKGDLADGFNDGGWDVVIEARDEDGRSEDHSGVVHDLEVIKLPDFTDLNDLEHWAVAECLRKVKEIEALPDDEFPSYANKTKRIEWATKDRFDWDRRIEGMKAERIRQATHALKMPMLTRWDDDACGFWLMEG